MRHLLPSLLLVLAACNQNARPLYYDGDPPTISGIGGESSTLGNLGGAEIALQGSGFGDDPTAVVVQFGSQNAEIVAVSDTELTLIVPNGPIEGGAVDVKVATEGGVALAEGLYTYEVGTLYEGEASYVHVNDYYYSCYGGAAADSAGVGCQDIVYLGTPASSAPRRSTTSSSPGFTRRTSASTPAPTSPPASGASPRRPTPCSPPA
ncbi:MAG: IPT/TIG domain-containing protein [Deltaproteobacteria bacterium]|nr:IPT/TIG domain-containing protein [Deltaproteobacteria bacterium]